MVLMYYDAIARVPELIVVILAGSMVMGIVMSTLFWHITQPNPWRVPPTKS